MEGLDMTNNKKMFGLQNTLPYLSASELGLLAQSSHQNYRNVSIALFQNSEQSNQQYYEQQESKLIYWLLNWDDFSEQQRQDVATILNACEFNLNALAQRYDEVFLAYTGLQLRLNSAGYQQNTVTSQQLNICSLFLRSEDSYKQALAVKSLQCLVNSVDCDQQLKAKFDGLANQPYILEQLNRFHAYDDMLINSYLDTLNNYTDETELRDCLSKVINLIKSGGHPRSIHKLEQPLVVLYRQYLQRYTDILQQRDQADGWLIITDDSVRHSLIDISFILGHIGQYLSKEALLKTCFNDNEHDLTSITEEDLTRVNDEALFNALNNYLSAQPSFLNWLGLSITNRCSMIYNMITNLSSDESDRQKQYEYLLYQSSPHKGLVCNLLGRLGHADALSNLMDHVYLEPRGGDNAITRFQACNAIRTILENDANISSMNDQLKQEIFDYFAYTFNMQENVRSRTKGAACDIVLRLAQDDNIKLNNRNENYLTPIMETLPYADHRDQQCMLNNIAKVDLDETSKQALFEVVRGMLISENNHPKIKQQACYTLIKIDQLQGASWHLLNDMITEQSSLCRLVVRAVTELQDLTVKQQKAFIYQAFSKTDNEQDRITLCKAMRDILQSEASNHVDNSYIEQFMNQLLRQYADTNNNTLLSSVFEVLAVCNPESIKQVDADIINNIDFQTLASYMPDKDFQSILLSRLADGGFPEKSQICEYIANKHHSASNHEKFESMLLDILNRQDIPKGLVNCICEALEVVGGEQTQKQLVDDIVQDSDQSIHNRASPTKLKSTLLAVAKHVTANDNQNSESLNSLRQFFKTLDQQAEEGFANPLADHLTDTVEQSLTEAINNYCVPSNASYQTPTNSM